MNICAKCGGPVGNSPHTWFECEMWEKLPAFLHENPDEADRENRLPVTESYSTRARTDAAEIAPGVWGCQGQLFTTGRLAHSLASKCRGADGRPEERKLAQRYWAEPDMTPRAFLALLPETAAAQLAWDEKYHVSKAERENIERATGPTAKSGRWTDNLDGAWRDRY